MSSTGITDKAGPTDIDIVFSTDASKRNTEGTKLYLFLVEEDFENYNKIEDKFSAEKRQIAQNIVEALLPGRFMKGIKGQQGKWKVLSMKDAEDRVMQRFCDVRRARKAKAAKNVSPKAIKTKKSRKNPKAAKKKTPSVNKTKKSCKIVKSTNTNVSKAAKVATDTTPSTPKGEPTITRLNIVTPTNDIEKSFESIELTGSPTSVAVPIYFSTPVVEVEKDLTFSDILAMEGAVDGVLELFDDLGEPTMAHQHVIAPTNDSEMLFEPFSLDGGDGVDDLANDADMLQFLSDILKD